MNSQDTANFGLTTTQKALWTAVPLLVSAVVILYGPTFTGLVGTAIFVSLGLVLGLISWFVSASWTFRLEITPTVIKVLQSGRGTTVPLEKVGMLVRSGWFPFPTLWLVLRGAEVGSEIPAKNLDPKVAAMLESYRRRNPGKKLTIVLVPGGHLRSVPAFAAELKRRIPPITLDERLGAN